MPSVTFAARSVGSIVSQVTMSCPIPPSMIWVTPNTWPSETTLIHMPSPKAGSRLICP
jgi:hypothetical protein